MRSLPPGASLKHTAENFPHLVNRLARVSDDSGQLRKLVDELMVDDPSEPSLLNRPFGTTNSSDWPQKTRSRFQQPAPAPLAFAAPNGKFES